MPVLRPSAAKASARLTATVDLPTPPFPDPTTTMWRTPGTAERGAGPGRPCAAACPVGGAIAGDLSEVTEIITLALRNRFGRLLRGNARGAERGLHPRLHGDG